jgi:uncharacterized membrane protein YjgN (DUF898 family)
MTQTPPPVAPQSSSSQAVWSLVLGILGIICCPILAPIAWWMGSSQLKAIRAGQGAAKGEGMAQAGMILGIIGTVLLVLSCIWVFMWGGLAILNGMFGR